jgi:hypothetical protein
VRALFATLGLLFVVVGCSTTPDLKRPVATENIARIKRVGVTSFLGDTVYGISLGTTSFNYAEFSAPVPDWKIDETAISQALAILRRGGRFQAAALDRTSYDTEGLLADGAKLLWEQAASQGFDTLVVVLPAVSESFRVFKPGYGIFERAFLSISHRCLYAAYEVDVYDVAARKRIAWQWGGDEGTPCLADSEQRLPFKARFDDYSVAEKRAMREGIEARIAETLAKALNKLELVSPRDAGR